MSYLQDREKKNIERIKKEIFLKNSNNPYYTNQTIYSINNEYDQFPYPHWYKGEVESDKPKIAEREAGWIPKRHKTPMVKEKETIVFLEEIYRSSSLFIRFYEAADGGC